MGLKELREKIDQIDDQILKLLNNRAEVVIEIGNLKQGEGLVSYHPDREKEVCQRLRAKNKGPLPDKAILAVYREIISGCRSLEGDLKIACLGPEATFTHLAAQKKFGASVEFVPVKSIADVFTEVEKGRANYGVVPIESSTEGVVTHTLDMFVDLDLKICSEVLLEVSHNLLSNSEFDQIKKVYSHPQAFAQSRSWLENNLPNVEYIETSSTAEAAKRAANDRDSAAVASELAASVYKLSILRAGIEDRGDNFTRFLVIGHNISAPTGQDKTSVLFSIKDRVGALYAMLKPFAEHKINLTKIESRPSRKQVWEYIFFLDMVGHIEDKEVKEALAELDELCLYLKVLGSYPIGD